MADTVDSSTEDSTFFDPNIRTPEMEMAEIGAGVPAAVDRDDLVFTSPQGHPLRRQHFRNRVGSQPSLKQASTTSHCTDCATRLPA